jgi:TonB family protein
VVNKDFLDIELLEDYLDGKLDSKTMYQIERQAEEDPFVAQALAGLSKSPRRSVQSLSLLQKQLYDRIGQQQVQKKRSVYTWQRLSIGAAAAVMFISVSIIFVMRDRQNREQRSKLDGRKVEVTVAPAVPLPTVSMPVGGWERFEVYLLNHKRTFRAAKGKSVKLSFNINTNGVPANISVNSSSLIKELDEDAVRLIKEGPKWQVPRVSSDKVVYRIDY